MLDYRNDCSLPLTIALSLESSMYYPVGNLPVVNLTCYWIRWKGNIASNRLVGKKCRNLYSENNWDWSFKEISIFFFFYNLFSSMLTFWFAWLLNAI